MEREGGGGGGGGGWGREFCENRSIPRSKKGEGGWVGGNWGKEEGKGGKMRGREE